MKKILIIEDDPEAIRILQPELRAEGFSVTHVSDAGAAIPLVFELQPEAVLVDLQTPGTPVEVVKSIRSHAATKNLPIIAMANEFERKSVDAAWAAGITSCINRTNCTPRAMVATIKRVLSSDKSARPSTRPSLPLPEKPKAEGDYHEQLRQKFLDGLPKDINQLRSLLQDVVKSEDAEQVERMQDLHRQVRWLSANAGLVELPNMACLASALEALLGALCQRPKQINVSTLRTTASAIDTLAMLRDMPEAAGVDAPLNASILAVDDEPVARRAVIQALERAHLKCVSLESPETALVLLRENRFDLIILDIEMPRMSGLDLCKELRTIPHHKKTPVIFVTNLSDFQHKTKSLLAGGNEFIAKPFVLMELAVKARVSVQQSEILRRKAEAAR